MFSQTSLKTVTFMFASRMADSSTESRDFDTLQGFKPRTNLCNETRLSGEVCLQTKVWRKRHADGADCQPVDAFRERKESMIFEASLAEIPNRKERMNSSFPPLLIDANTSEIRLFADQQRQQNAAADEVVMDRGAECTAGGCDAI